MYVLLEFDLKTVPLKVSSLEIKSLKVKSVAIIAANPSLSNKRPA